MMQKIMRYQCVGFFSFLIMLRGAFVDSSDLLKQIFQLAIKICLLALFLPNIVPAFASEVVWSGTAQDNVMDRKGIATGDSAKELLRLLQEFPWTEEKAHNNSEEYVYVLFYPECPASQQLFEESRKYLGKINIRWIPITQDLYNAALFEKRTPEVLSKAFRVGLTSYPEDSEYVEKLIALTDNIYSILVELSAGGPENTSYFPTVLFGSESEMRVQVYPWFRDVMKQIKKMDQ